MELGYSPSAELPTSQQQLSPDLSPTSLESVASGHPVEARRPQNSVWRIVRSLQFKATALAIAIGTVPVLAIGATAYYFANESIVRQIEQDKQIRATQLANEIGVFMADRFADIQVLAQLPIFTDPEVSATTSTEEKVALLDRYVSLYGVYNSVALFDLEGETVVQAVGRPVPNHLTRDYFVRIMNTGEPTINPPSISRTTGTLSMHIASPVKDANTGDITGVIRFQLPVAGLDKIAREYANEGEDYYLIDSNGRYFLASGNADRINQPAEEHFVAYEQLVSAQAVASVLDIDPDDESERLLTYAPLTDLAGLPELDFGVLIASDLDVVFAPQRQLRQTISLGTAIAALLVGAISTLLVNREVRPIVAAANAVRSIGRGELDTRLEVKGEDEVAVLGTNVNQMAAQLQALAYTERQSADATRLLSSITSQRTLDEGELMSVFSKALAGARQWLGVDRMVIYRFNPNWSGYIASEAVASGWPVAYNEAIEDACISSELLDAYREGRVAATQNVAIAGFHPEHQELMRRLKIKANLVVPIISQGELYGLLVAHDCTAPHAWDDREIAFMKQLSAQMSITLDRVAFLQDREEAARRSDLLKDITLQFSRATSSKALLDIAVQQSRKAIATDRVIVYSFDETWKGTVVAESVAGSWPKAMGAQIADPCFAESYVEQYRQGRIQAVSDIDKADLTPCYSGQLQPFAVRANLVAPILIEGELEGLLIAHQCSAPRDWEQPTIDLFAQLAIQVGQALDRVNLLERQRRSEALQRQTSETLQRRALELLREVDPVSQGDLTVRTTVTEDEIGTIADSYNSTIANLRGIVAQVQEAAKQVTDSTSNNQTFVSTLSQEAERQAADIANALDRIQTMNASIRNVAARAERAEAAVQRANQTVTAGDAAMNRTVDSILTVRETVTDAAQKVRELGQASRQISQMGNTIAKFASQTHLLALKASIEAARAGEEGKGFAVIAEEVRSLAAQSAEATANIESLVTSIQTATDEVAASMEAGTEQVATGTQLVEETRRNLSQVVEFSAQIEQLVEAIAAAAVEQSEASASVAQTMTEVAATSQNTSANAMQSSESFKQLLATAQALQMNVRQFKVS